MNALWRMVDANSNRAAEALRTLEDLARFAIGAGADAAVELRSLRHELRFIVASTDAHARLAARDAASDPGSPDARTRRGEIERSARRDHAPDRDRSANRRESEAGADGATRRDAADIAAAASSRLGEALRSLEEALRVLRPDAAGAVERLRFRAYDAAARVERSLLGGRARQWRLCLLLTESICRRPWREVLNAALDAGADCVQVREKALSDSALLSRVRAVIEAARPRGASVIVNDRADLALAAGADGVHLGTEDLPIDAVRRLGGTLLVGSSTHDPAEALAAVSGGADYCGVGAMFATSLKPDREPSGVAYLREFIAAHPRTPHLAIGGITPERVPALVDAGCRGVAVSAAICGAADPGETAARIVASLGSSTASASTRASDAGPFAARDESAETRAASDRECRA